MRFPWAPLTCVAGPDRDCLQRVWRTHAARGSWLGALPLSRHCWPGQASSPLSDSVSANVPWKSSSGHWEGGRRSLHVGAFKRFADEARSAKLFARAPADPPPRSPRRGRRRTPTVAGSQIPAVERRSPAGPGAIRLQSPGLCRACPGLVPRSLQPPWRGPWVPPRIRPPSFLPSRPHPAVLTP